MNNNILKTKIHIFIKQTYLLTDKFPKHEIYGLTSQLRRAAVSVMLNYLEGFARFKEKIVLNFYEISFGSIKECKYLLYLSKELNYIEEQEYNQIIGIAEEISAMLWKTIKTQQDKILD
jgi:four helix bundle protein